MARRRRPGGANRTETVAAAPGRPGLLARLRPWLPLACVLVLLLGCLFGGGYVLGRLGGAGAFAGGLNQGGTEMLPLKRILCPTDFSADSRAAMRVANEMTLYFSAELILLHVVPAPMPAVMGSSSQRTWW